MAAAKPKRQIERASAGGLAYPSPTGPATPHGLQNGGVKKQLNRLETVAVQLYANGVARTQVRDLLLKYLCPPDGNMSVDQRRKVAMRRLRQMEERKWFRDALWEHSLIQADLETPAIINGLVRKAKRGKVDAAKLTLGLVGRYTDHAEQQATSITIQFGSDIPRPPSRAELEAEPIEEGEWEE